MKRARLSHDQRDCSSLVAQRVCVCRRRRLDAESLSTMETTGTPSNGVGAVFGWSVDGGRVTRQQISFRSKRVVDCGCTKMKLVLMGALSHPQALPRHTTHRYQRSTKHVEVWCIGNITTLHRPSLPQRDLSSASLGVVQGCLLGTHIRYQPTLCGPTR